MQMNWARNRLGFTLKYVSVDSMSLRLGQSLKVLMGNLLTHIQGRIPDVTLACIQYLRKQFPSVRVSVEAEKPGRPGLQELADAADMVFFSKSWAQVSFMFRWVRVGDK